MRKSILKHICLALVFLLTFSLTFQPVFATASKPILKKGMSGSEVTKLQSNLKQLGFFKQNPTGYYGDTTEIAVKSFQKKYGIPATGVVAALTHNKLDALIKQLNAIKVVIDPGHGGIDKGTSSGNAVESVITLDISKKLKSCLEKDNYSAILTRSSDVALDNLSDKGATREEQDLNARTNIINSNKAKLFVSIHVNSIPSSPQMSGSVVYYNDKIPQSKVLAVAIQKELNAIKINNKSRSAHNAQEADFYVLRNSNIPGVLVETAIITNTGEKQLLMSDDFRNKIAKAIMAGIKNTKF